jgi:hypothetical protein
LLTRLAFPARLLTKHIRTRFSSDAGRNSIAIRVNCETRSLQIRILLQKFCTAQFRIQNSQDGQI